MKMLRVIKPKNIILFYLLFLMFFLCFHINNSFAYNTPAGTIVTNNIYMSWDSSYTITNTNTIQVSSNFGGTFTTSISDRTNFPGVTEYYTNIFRNDANHEDIFQLQLTYENYSVGADGSWTNWFETLGGSRVSMFTLGQGDFFTNRLVFTMGSNAVGFSYVAFRIAVKAVNNTNATNYMGDNSVAYGGDLGDGIDGCGYINMISIVTTTLTALVPDPSQVILIKPASNSWTNGNPLFEWYSSLDLFLSKVTNYRIEISSNGFISINTSATVNATNFQNIPVLSDDTWSWRVFALDDYGNESVSSAVWVVDVDTVLPTISAMDPVSNYVSEVVDVNFTWTVADLAGPNNSDVMSNWIEIDTNGNMSADVIYGYSGLTTGTNYNFGVDGTNYWRIIVKDNAGNEATNNWYSLIIDSTTPIPILYYPTNVYITNLRPEFRWQGFANVDTNRIQVSVDDFGTYDINVLTAATNYTPGADLAEGTNYWRVIARKIGTTSWYTSIPAIFYIDRTGPPQVSLLNPISNTLISTNDPVVAWNSVVDALSGLSFYDVEMSSNNFSGTQRSTTIAAGIETWPVVALLGDGTWTWRVRGVDVLGNEGNWRSEWTIV